RVAEAGLLVAVADLVAVALDVALHDRADVVVADRGRADLHGRRDRVVALADVADRAVTAGGVEVEVVAAGRAAGDRAVVAGDDHVAARAPAVMTATEAAVGHAVAARRSVPRAVDVQIVHALREIRAAVDALERVAVPRREHAFATRLLDRLLARLAVDGELRGVRA